MNNLKADVSRDKIALYLKIGILGAIIILAGDMLIGWGLKDMTKTGIESQISQYLTVPDKRMILAAVMGFTGVPVAVVGHYGIYRILKPYSVKYARLYGIGILGFLAFGGAGVHVSSIEAAFFYKYMTAAGSDVAVESAMKFVVYFLAPLYIILLTGWVVMVYAQIRAVLGNLSPYPRWFWIFSMPAGLILFSFIGVFGNHEIVNALMVGTFSLGNIWTLAGHLFMLPKTWKN